VVILALFYKKAIEIAGSLFFGSPNQSNQYFMGMEA